MYKSEVGSEWRIPYICEDTCQVVLPSETVQLETPPWGLLQ